MVNTFNTDLSVYYHNRGQTFKAIIFESLRSLVKLIYAYIIAAYLYCFFSDPGYMPSNIVG